MPRLPLLSFTLTLAVLTAACDRQDAEPAQPQENSAEANLSEGEELTGIVDRTFAGSDIPDVTVTDPSGTTLALAETKGKPVLLNLWATWCAPCVVEMPLLDELAAELGNSVRVLTVSEDLKGAEVVVPFFEQKGYEHLPQWIDAENDLAVNFGGVSLPLTVLYDAEGKEVWRVIGGYDWGSAEARELIAEGISDG